MTNTRGFAYGLAIGIPIGAGILLGAYAIRRQLRFRAEHDQGPFIDGVHSSNQVMADWTLQHEANSALHDLVSEAPDVSAESQRW